MSHDSIDTSRPVRRGIRPITFVALAVSIVTAVAVWSGLLRGDLRTLVFLLLVVAVCIVTGIVLNIIAGVRGGIDRWIGIVGGVILLSTVLFPLVGLIGLQTLQDPIQL